MGRSFKLKAFIKEEYEKIEYLKEGSKNPKIGIKIPHGGKTWLSFQDKT